ncbi:unnamed protein product [Nyctereutes procyonoides]|uniref:(raccoon dog) hypothetical protein n=1 Tax=Nyctereutes procyonoides TaxID=34880 RepID=A0A811XT58_NYCPR|nr:unnamed protein product [Nyctereutes procyonoides]
MDNLKGPRESTSKPEPFLPGVEAQAKHPESPKETETPPLHPPEAPAVPSRTPEVQQEASAQPTEITEEVEPSTPHKARVQPPEEEVPPQEVNVPSLSQNEAQWPKLHNVTVKPVDLALTVTVTQPPQHPEKAEPSPGPQEAPDQPEEAGPTPVPQETPAQLAGPTPVQEDAPTVVSEFPIEYPLLNLPQNDELIAPILYFIRLLTPEPTKDVESATAQQEAPLQPLEHTEEADPSSPQQETSAKPPEEVELSHEQEQPAQPLEPPAGIESSLIQQDTPAQPTPSVQEPTAQLSEPSGSELSPPPPPKNPEEEKPSPQEEASAEPAELPNEAETSTQQETPELSLGEVEPIPTQQEHPAQPLEHHEVTVAPPGHHQVQPLNLPNITVKPADVQVTVTPEPTTEVGPLPVQHESVVQPSVMKPQLCLHSPLRRLYMYLPVQQETPTESPESPTQEKPPTQQETPVQTPGEVKPSTTQQDTLAQDSQAPEEDESPSTQEEALAQLPGTQEEEEPSPPQQEAPAELPQIPEEGEPSSIQEESQGHHAQTPEKAKPSSTQQEVPTQYPQASEEGEPPPAQEEAPTQFNRSRVSIHRPLRRWHLLQSNKKPQLSTHRAPTGSNTFSESNHLFYLYSLPFKTNVATSELVK